MAELDDRLPPLPELDPDLLAAWQVGHDGAADAVAALGGPLGTAFRRWTLGHMVLALAGRTPTRRGWPGDELLPAPRAFLGAHDLARIAGTRAAFGHIDVRVALVEGAHERSVVRPETPYVLHALAEGGDTNLEETNPGTLRVRDTGWVGAPFVYTPPPAADIRDLVDALTGRAAALAADDGVPPPALAGWVAFTLMAIHPFVDGNGRTARLLYLALTAPSLRLRLDHGIAERWAVDRRGYLDALWAGDQDLPGYLPRQMDARPFAEASLRWSIGGAELLAMRAGVVMAAAAALARRHPMLSEAEVSLAVWVALERHAPATRFAVAGDRTDSTAERVPVEDLEALCAKGVLARRPLPPSRRPPGGARTIGYVATERVTACLADAARARAAGAHGP